MILFIRIARGPADSESGVPTLLHCQPVQAPDFTDDICKQPITNICITVAMSMVLFSIMSVYKDIRN